MALSVAMDKELNLLAGKNILIVDDDIRNTFALSSYLEEQDMIVHTAASGYDALELLMTMPEIDLVLMDVMMPGMDGFETIQRIRTNPMISLMPVIAVTAKAMKGDREKCLAAGASEYVSKPVIMNELLKKMIHLLNQVK